LEIVEPPPRVIEETASDFAGNAALKALAYSAEGLAIASDGGLEVPALAGAWDPLLTHRQGQARLRELTAGLRNRQLRWAEAVALADKGQLLATWTASGTEGVLANEPWTESSEFWVWDIFVFPALGKPWSHLSPTERAVVDHTWLSLKQSVQAHLR
jgi:inosine/xanthosine triphosphate pyrophosphatase family protein